MLWDLKFSSLLETSSGLIAVREGTQHYLVQMDGRQSHPLDQGQDQIGVLLLQVRGMIILNYNPHPILVLPHLLPLLLLIRLGGITTSLLCHLYQV